MMNASVEDDADPQRADQACGLNGQFSKSSYESLGTSTLHGDGDQDSKTPEPTSPKANPMAFTIDLGPSKPVDRSRLEELAKKSQARHQRVHSMFASLTKPSPVEQKAPMSAKLPRKAQGYNSEGYFSSDQEDGLGSVKRQSPLAQSLDRTHISSTTVCLKSPDLFAQKRVSKSPIVDSIMSRSDTLPSRQNLNLPLKNTNSSYLRDVHRGYGMLSSSYQPRGAMADIIDQSPEGLLLTDISSPELDILTPDNPPVSDHSSPRKMRRAMSEAPDLLLTKCPPMQEPLFIDDDVDRESNNSSTGTYTIEAEYTEEQKARMSIDRTLASGPSANDYRGASSERDPELVYDYLEPKTLRNNLMSPENKYTPKAKDRNILEIACCYESPPENDLAAQTSKQIKSTRSYLEKIKSRVKTITDRTFSRSPPKFATENMDVGSFTSVTTSGVLSSKPAPRRESLRRYSLTKSEIDRTDFIHRLSRESSVPVSLPSKKLEEKFESTPLRLAQRLREEQAAKSEQVVGQLSYLSLNRCKGDKNWIQDWADSVKRHNKDSLGEGDINYIDDRPPQSPRRENVKGASPRGSSAGTPTKIPSPVGTLLQRRTPDLIPSAQDTESYLQRTQHAISSLQAKLQTRSTPLTCSYHEPSKLPVTQLSRSNSLNYRIRSRDGAESPGDPNSSSQNPDRSIVIKSCYNVDAILSPHRRHARHKSFDGRATELNASTVSLKTVLRNNAEASRIDPTRSCHDNGNIRRSSSFTTVRNGCQDSRKAGDDVASYLSDDSRDGGGRVESPDFKSIVPTNSPRCANTPEFQRKSYGNVRSSVRVTSRERGLNTLGATERGLRMSEPRQTERPASHQSRRVSEPTRQAVVPRLAKSRSSTRELQPKVLNKALKKPAQHRSSSALATKEIEFTNWKKRSSYDPMKAAQEGRRRQMSKRQECNKDDMSSPSHSSPVHRSQSFHTTGANMADLTIDYSSEEDTLPIDNAMVTSTHSDLPAVRRTEYRDIRRQPLNKEVVLAKEYVPNFQINQKLRNADRRKTFIIDDVTPTRENVDFLPHQARDNDFLRHPTRDNDFRRHPTRDNDATVDKRRTFILDSDNSTTNESSPRNSSVFSHDKGTSDTEESGAEGSPVVLRHPAGSRTPVGGRPRPASGDYSMSSSATSTNKRQHIQPRYLDISKYKCETSPKTFLRRDPSKTYVGVLPDKPSVSKGSAQQYELEQKRQELEKWRRRASYDPRKAAARAKTQPKPANNVLRSQSFHGPLQAARSRPPPLAPADTHDSDNDF